MRARTMTEASVAALPPTSTSGLLVYVTGWTAGRAQGLRGIVSCSVQSAARTVAGGLTRLMWAASGKVQRFGLR